MVKYIPEKYGIASLTGDFYFEANGTHIKGEIPSNISYYSLKIFGVNHNKGNYNNSRLCFFIVPKDSEKTVEVVSVRKNPNSNRYEGGCLPIDHFEVLKDFYETEIRDKVSNKTTSQEIISKKKLLDSHIPDFNAILNEGNLVLEIFSDQMQNNEIRSHIKKEEFHRFEVKD